MYFGDEISLIQINIPRINFCLLEVQNGTVISSESQNSQKE